jgi:hypothetical protein
MSKEKADQAAEKIKAALSDFPTFLLFCVGDNGGFALGGIDESSQEKSNSRLAAQIQDALTCNPTTLEFFRTIVENADNARKKIN